MVSLRLAGSRQRLFVVVCLSTPSLPVLCDRFVWCSHPVYAHSPIPGELITVSAISPSHLYLAKQASQKKRFFVETFEANLGCRFSTDGRADVGRIVPGDEFKTLSALWAEQDGVKHPENEVCGVAPCEIYTVLFLFGILLSSLVTPIALKLEDRDSYSAINTMISMPLFFTSSAMRPYGDMPDWLVALAKLNPVSYAIDAIRDLPTEIFPAVTLPEFPIGAVLILLVSATAFRRVTV